ncbi:MAG: cyanophycin synthetase [Candidatus Peregrinibacteria bacterium]
MIIYCSGIGGIGLSAYAAFQKHAGHTVLGSDRADSVLLMDLRSQGIGIFLQQDGSQIPSDADLFVYSEAIPASSSERVRAAELGIPQKTYFEALGELTMPFRLISVAGTHGKSSTTAMAAKVLMDSSLDPSVIVGTKLKDLGGRNWRYGKSTLFVAESCEYRRSFRFLHPSIILLTNADGDHFDYYTSQEDYESAFMDFVKSLPDDGLLITHLSDPACAKIAALAGRRTIDADLETLPELSVSGLHMRKNAQLVLSLAGELHLSRPEVLSSLRAFSGTWRRMEVRGTRSDGVTVVDDYAHHPAEIRATLQGMREQFPGRRLVVVFQPHTHDRTLKLYQDFLTAFTGADMVIISYVYEARSDRDSGKVDLPRFIADLQKGSGVQVIDGHSLSEIEQKLRQGILKSDDVLITMGAGDVTELAGRILG